MKLLHILLLIPTLALAAPAFADNGNSANLLPFIITFDNLTGSNGDPFTTYTEGGFTVSPTLGMWFQGQLIGNPVPSIFSSPLIGSPATDAIVVTQSGALFEFDVLYLAAERGNVNFTITGVRGGATIYNFNGTVAPDPSGAVFFDFIRGASDLVDSVVVTTEILGTSAYIDNIFVFGSSFAQIPEPASLAILGIGLAGWALVWIRRNRNGLR